jgi:hypothetical protein
VTGSSGGEWAEWTNDPEPCDEYEGGRASSFKNCNDDDCWCIKKNKPYSKCESGPQIYVTDSGPYYALSPVSNASCDWGFGRSSGNDVMYSCSGNTSKATAGQSGKVEFFEWKP